MTHTNSERQPWWQVELAERADIARVVLYNRTDCCASRLKDVHVLVSEYPIAEQSLDDLLAQSGITHQYLSGVQGREIELPMNSSGRYVRVQLAGTGYLSLAEVQVHGVPNPESAPPALATNLAPSGTASQSSTGYSGEASRANDRNANGVYRQATVTHTTREAQPWWEVALAEASQVERVILYNRTDCCASRLKDVHVFVSSEPFAGQTLEQLLSASDIEHEYLAGVQGRQIELAIEGPGQYVRVQLAGTDYLSLAEVQVMGIAGAVQ